MEKNEAKSNQIYLSREERLRQVAKQVVVSKQSARAFLISAGVLDHDGKLAAHLR